MDRSRCFSWPSRAAPLTRAAPQARAALLLAVPLLLIGAGAFADGVPVSITNNGTEDIVVTVYDTTLRPHEVVMSQRINGFSSVPLTMSPDASGRANVSWTAVTVDPNHRRCGHAEQKGLADSSTVNVSAHSACAAT